MLKVKGLQEVMISKWNLPWKSSCELVKHSFAEVFRGLICCSAGSDSVWPSVVCKKKEKVIKMMMCLHLGVMLQCWRAKLSSLTGTGSREALPGSLRPFLFTDGHSLPHCPLVQTHCYSWGEISGVLAQFHWLFLGNDSSFLPITQKGLWPLNQSSCSVNRALKQCLANIRRLQRLHLLIKVKISRFLKSYMSFCGEFCLLMKIFLNPAELKEEAVWLSHWRGWNTWLFFVELNSFVAAVAKPMWKWLKRHHGIKCYPSGNHIHSTRVCK